MIYWSKTEIGRVHNRNYIRIKVYGDDNQRADSLKGYFLSLVRIAAISAALTVFTTALANSLAPRYRDRENTNGNTLGK